MWAINATQAPTTNPTNKECVVVTAAAAVGVVIVVGSEPDPIAGGSEVGGPSDGATVGTVA